MRFIEIVANIAVLATFWPAANSQTAPARGMCSNPPAVVFRNQYCVECSTTPWPNISDTSAPFDLPGLRAGSVNQRTPRTRTTTAGGRVSGQGRLVIMQPANRKGEARELQLFPIGTKLYYQAKIGFDLDGPVVIECLAGGEWSEPPTCFKSCRKLPTIQNGRCGTDNFKFVKVNQRVNCQCDEGFSMDGPERITCRLDGNFTRAPSCSIITTEAPVTQGCKLPPLRNGVCRDLNTQTYLGLPLGIKETFACSCNEGFELIPFSGAANVRRGSAVRRTSPMTTRTRSGRNGAASEGTTRARGSSRKETIAPGGLPNDGPCQPICDGDGEYSCLPTCRRIPPTTTPLPVCPYPPSINNSGCVECVNHQRIEFFNYGDHFTYRCDPGYMLVGNPKITCQRNGQWSRGPQCVAAATTTLGPNCGPVPTIVNGHCLAENDDSDVDVHFAGKEATCKCNNRFVLEGDDVITCVRRPGGLVAWSQPPVCQAVTTTPRPECTLESIQNLVPYSFCRGAGPIGTTITVFKVGQKAVCECLEAYEEVYPSREATCKGGNQWSDLPSCKLMTTTLAPQRCTPPTFVNGYCSNDDDANYNYALGETIKCKCNTGFRLTNEATMATITCNQKAANLRDPEGAWSVAPTCTAAASIATEKPAACPAPVIASGLSCTTTGTRPLASGADAGDVLTCTCPSSSTMNGSRSVTCRSGNRGWSAALPTCTPTVAARATTRAPTTTKKATSG